MLLDSSPKLEDEIIKLLSSCPASSVEELYAKLGSMNARYARSSLYQELRKLVAAGVLVRVKGRYLIRLGWTLDILNFAEASFKQQLNPKNVINILPEEGKVLKVRCSSLRELGKVWTQLLAALVSGGEDLYEWAPHPWFILSHEFEEQQLIRTLKQFNSTHFLSCLYNTCLGQSYLEKTRGIKRKLVFGRNVFQKSDGIYYSVVGDFVVTVSLNKQLVPRLNEIFFSRTFEKRSMILRLFGLRYVSSLKLERNRILAEKMRTKLAGLFT